MTPIRMPIPSPAPRERSRRRPIARHRSGVVLAAFVVSLVVAPFMAQADTAAVAEVVTLRAPSTLEAAAHAALTDAVRRTPAWQRDRLRAGVILRVAGAYVWGPAHVAPSAQRPVVRLGLDREHAATYVVHPRTGEPSVDRANESISRAERALVDRVDPLHRPLFVLTPSGRLLRYASGEEVREIIAPERTAPVFGAAALGRR